MKKIAPLPTSSNTLVAIPTMGWLRTELMTWVKESKFDFITSNAISPHSKARNYLFQQFLMHEYDYMLCIDSDTIPYPNTFPFLAYLINKGADVATGITPIINQQGIRPNVYRTHESIEQKQTFADLPTGPFEVVGAGMSYMLITKDIIERVSQLTFGHPCRTLEFEDGKYCSEDLFFCDKVREIGGKIVCHPHAMAAHVKEHDFTF